MLGMFCVGGKKTPQLPLVGSNFPAHLTPRFDRCETVRIRSSISITSEKAAFHPIYADASRRLPSPETADNITVSEVLWPTALFFSNQGQRLYVSALYCRSYRLSAHCRDFCMMKHVMGPRPRPMFRHDDGYKMGRTPQHSKLP